MFGLAKGRSTDSRSTTRSVAVAGSNAPFRAAGQPPTCLMPPGCGLAIPRLDGVPHEHQLWQGEKAAARLAHSFLEAGIADADDWIAPNRNPFEFLKRALERWLRKHDELVIREQFFLDVLLSTTVGRYFANDGKMRDVSRVFLALEPDSAGYVILGPTLRLLDGIHPKLSATFLGLFLGALNRWLRLYDHGDALDRVERLREWYESDPEDEVELPDIGRCLPESVKRRPLSRRAVAAMVPEIRDPLARELMELAIALDRLSCQRKRPEIDAEVRELLIDCGEPVPALLAVFEQNDPIEGCFDEDCLTMLELTPAPNLIIPFNGEAIEGVLGAFGVLATVCETLSCASRLITLMPGNDRLN
jgi:hypothetical protein